MSFLFVYSIYNYNGCLCVDLITSFHEMGISSSYDRVLEFTKEIGDKLDTQFETHGVFVPGDLKKGLFTTTAKNNVDSNASSSTGSRHYHGTSTPV